MATLGQIISQNPNKLLTVVRGDSEYKINRIVGNIVYMYGGQQFDASEFSDWNIKPEQQAMPGIFQVQLGGSVIQSQSFIVITGTTMQLPVGDWEIIASATINGDSQSQEAVISIFDGNTDIPLSNRIFSWPQNRTSTGTSVQLHTMAIISSDGNVEISLRAKTSVGVLSFVSGVFVVRRI